MCTTNFLIIGKSFLFNRFEQCGTNNSRQFIGFCFRYVGFSQMNTPILYIRDPELIKQICIKDFDHFPEHQSFGTDGDVDPLWDKNLFAAKSLYYYPLFWNAIFLL